MKNLSIVIEEQELQVGEEFVYPEEHQHGNQLPIKGILTQNGCIECSSHSVVKGNYPQCMRNGKVWYIHRYVYTKWCEELPAGHVVMHKCDNPLCINIEHLTHGTHKDNNDDKVKKGRQAKGASHGRSRLTKSDAIYIKFLSDELDQ